MNLKQGQSCFYKVKAKCGGPAFTPSDASKVEIEYVEFNSDDAVFPNDTATGQGKNSNDATKKASPPFAMMPRRNQNFYAELGGNAVFAGNQTVTVDGTGFQGRTGRYDKTAGSMKAFGQPK